MPSGLPYVAEEGNQIKSFLLFNRFKSFYYFAKMKSSFQLPKAAEGSYPSSIQEDY